ncbi:hypothetical protein V8G54_026222 [Vigna mungo]|uniref:FBD domain-containing protein n=1 Tax=Vigna mungo TaxID=3915 RepID=A0AAQ3RPA9_VIGMU
MKKIPAIHFIARCALSWLVMEINPSIEFASDVTLSRILLKDIVIPSMVFSFKTLVALNLEYITVEDIGLACQAKGKLIRLPKLVRVSIDKPLLPLEIFKDVEVLKFDYVMPIFQPNLYLNFDFHNLVQPQVSVELDWLLVLKVHNHCLKLQSLVIDIFKIYEEEGVWLYPQNIPACISSHLKTCCLIDYHGSKDEFKFA